MRFYRLFSDEGKRKKFAWAFPPFGFGSSHKLVECGFCGRKWNSCIDGHKCNIPYPITYTNNYFPDFMCCQDSYLISIKMKQIIENNRINVARFAEMPVVGKSDFTKEQFETLRDIGYDVNKFHDKKPIYYRLNSEVGASLHSDSKIVWLEDGEERCKHCGYGVGYYPLEFFVPECILLDSWNGNDLFKVKEFIGVLYCTEQFKKMCEEAMLTGIMFKEIEAK